MVITSWTVERENIKKFNYPCSWAKWCMFLLSKEPLLHYDGFSIFRQEFRTHYFGWSFVLAWICIALCFLHTWVWLSKAQDMPEISPRLTSDRRFKAVHKQHLLVVDDWWWRHQMETFSALLAICAGDSPVTGEFPSQRPVTPSFDGFFHRLNKRLSTQSRGWWFETPLRSLWRHCNDDVFHAASGDSFRMDLYAGIV